MNILLTGKKEYNLNNLTGKSHESILTNYDKIKQIKEKILSDYIIPFFSK